MLVIILAIVALICGIIGALRVRPDLPWAEAGVIFLAIAILAPNVA